MVQSRMDSRRLKIWLALVLVAVLLGSGLVQAAPSGCTNMAMMDHAGKSAPCHDSMPSCLLAGGCIAVPASSVDITGMMQIVLTTRHEAYAVISGELLGRSIAPDIRPPILLA
jgi:hypothetical protein